MTSEQEGTATGANDPTTVEAIRWRGDVLELLDQRNLPVSLEWLSYDSAPAVADAIEQMVVRGAPAIGIAAAYGCALSCRMHAGHDDFFDLVAADLERLEVARPTAVNLAWAVSIMRDTLARLRNEPIDAIVRETANAACAIHAADRAANLTMGRLGADLLPSSARVLTHCNAGALATGGFGTALGVVRVANHDGKLNRLYACETRPWLQGARLTAWELLHDGIDVTLLADSAASFLMQGGELDWIVVGADRVAANGDVANKIGTYALAVAAQHHGVKFMVVAPASTIDMDTGTGADIPVEWRSADELTRFQGRNVAPAGASVWNPVFDVTPARLVDVLVTEKGVIEAPDEVRMKALFG
jgi:methylthioribose-1-phosphate isomerase